MTKTKYAIIAQLLLPHNGMYALEIDSNGDDACDNETFEGFETFEDAQSALDWIKEKNFDNYLSFNIQELIIED